MVAVKEGINLPRYPSLPGRMRAKKADDRRSPAGVAAPTAAQGAAAGAGGARAAGAEILGHGVDAVPALVALLGQLGVLP